jgi:putative Mg2+ transporter-C (MgtC) family protein
MEELISKVSQSLATMEVTPLSASLKLLVSFVLGAIIGAERQSRRQSAGIRTFSLICIGSTAAMLLSIWIPQSYPDFLNGDPGRIAAQILTGIGFLGAGAIIQSRGSILGLTTASTIWVVAIMGMAVGAGMYLPAIVLTFLSLFVLFALDRFEKRKSLTGQIKQLIVHFETDAPQINQIVQIVQNNAIFIYDVSVERNYKQQTSQLTVKIQTQPRETLDALFEEIRLQEFVSSINLTVLF